MNAGTIDISQALCDQVIGRQLAPWMESVTEGVSADAFQRCPVGTPDPLGRPRLFDTPLRFTISPRVEGTGVNLIGRVVANSPYAIFVHGGTQPHSIQPIGRGYPLRFFWPKIGAVATPWHVNHPGTPAQPFLRDALVTVVGSLQAA